jgi:hypothetical protein
VRGVVSWAVGRGGMVGVRVGEIDGIVRGDGDSVADDSTMVARMEVVGIPPKVSEHFA